MLEKYCVAICQMDSQDNKEHNLAQAVKMIQESAEKGARLAVFPENMNYMGRGYRKQAEVIPGRTSEILCDAAKKYEMWVVSGSIPEVDTSGNPKNTVMLISPEGKICCKYSKIHMFDVNVPGGQSYQESKYNTAGKELIVYDTELGSLGLAICYDLRFGEMFRLMTLAGAKIICIPSSFTADTGKKHWETLLRARAIENEVYIIAANQIGKKVNMEAYGESMIVDPWGNIIARSNKKIGVTVAEVDLKYLETVRSKMPVLSNRRTDVYQLQTITKQNETF